MNVYHWTEDGQKIEGSGKRIPGGDVDAYAKAAARGLFAECDTMKTTFDGKPVDESRLPIEELRRRYVLNIPSQFGSGKVGERSVAFILNRERFKENPISKTLFPKGDFDGKEFTTEDILR